MDLEYVRNQFPALSGGFTFMDNAGGSQTLKSVVDRIAEYLLTSDVQLGASYALSQLAGARVNEGIASMATYMNAARNEEIIFGSSTSSLIKTLSLCLRQTWQEGDEVIVTNTDHEANVSPWTALQASGIKVKIWQANPNTFHLDLADLEALLTPRTRLVAVTHTSNILGTINPIAEIAEKVHSHGAQICVDGVAYAPHRALDVQAWGIDYYVFSCYKVYGPHQAVMYGQHAHLEKLPKFNHYFIDEIPYKLQPGNVNYELCYGTSAIAQYFQDLAKHHAPNQEFTPRAAIEAGFQWVAQQEEQLATRLLEFLNSKAEVRIIGETSPSKALRVPTISFVVENRDSESLPLACDPHKIGIRFGDFYAKKLVEQMDLTRYNGVVRVSLVHYNTLEEVDRLIAILDQHL